MSDRNDSSPSAPSIHSSPKMVKQVSIDVNTKCASCLYVFKVPLIFRQDKNDANYYEGKYDCPKCGQRNVLRMKSSELTLSKAGIEGPNVQATATQSYNSSQVESVETKTDTEILPLTVQTSCTNCLTAASIELKFEIKQNSAQGVATYSCSKCKLINKVQIQATELRNRSANSSGALNGFGAALRKKNIKPWKLCCCCCCIICAVLCGSEIPTFV